MPSRKPLLALTAGGLSIIVAGLLWWFRPAGEVALDVADVRFTTVQGEQLRLADLRGHPVLVSFWASDCGPCIAEIPELVRLHRELGTEGLQLLAVAMSYDLPSRVLALIQSADVPYRVILDLGGTIAAAFGHVDRVPMAFVIGREGAVLQRIEGPIDFASLRRQLLPMLREF